MSSLRQGSWRRSSNFQRGGSLNLASGNHSSGVQTQRPCNFFLRTGTCRYGSDWRFSHQESSGNTEPAPSFEAEHGRNNYLEWKRLLRRPPSHLDNRSELAEFWSQALAIIESSTADHHQSLVKDLTDDKYEGCLYLIRTIEMRFDFQWDNAGMITRNMLRLITHRKILDCLSIDTPIGTIYNVISGSNGSRAVPFLICFCVNLEDGFQRQVVPMQELTDCVQLVLDTTHELISREKRVAFCDELPNLFDRLDLVISFLDTERDRQMKTDRLGVLKKVARLSTGLLSTSANGVQTPFTGKAANTPSVYPRELKLPGTRHDNDHLNIADISILPTVGELMSDQVDYLPSTDFRRPHFLDDPVQRYLDTHFRLLRHDVFGPLKEVLGTLIPCVARNAFPLVSHSFDANVHLYHNSGISHVSVNEKRGLELHISFAPPKHLRDKTSKERQKWWAAAKRLEVGSLLYLVFAANDSVVILTFTVSDRAVEGPQERNLLSASSPIFKAKLAMQGTQDIGNALFMYTEKRKGIIVELPGLLPGTFSPVLENLQKSVTTGWIPFQEWIIPKPEEPQDRARSLEPPLYARAADFSFSLDSIALDNGPPLSLSAICSPDDVSLIDNLESRLTLDHGQCQALVAALTQEFSLIQGPPGTGKSYLGVQLIRVLLDCKKKADLGPIVIVCYTNHALDQFLMHLRDVGITKFIRIGGQSRTPEIDEHNLRNVTARAPKMTYENFILGSSYASLEDGMKCMGRNLAAFHQLRKDSLPSLHSFLRRKHPRIHAQFFPNDILHFARVGKDPVGSWLGFARGVEPETPPTQEVLNEEESQMRLLRQAEEDVDKVAPGDRRRLIDIWLDQLRQDRIELLHENIVETEGYRKEIAKIHSEVNRRTLADADVIGITTTGMARDVSLLRGLRSKVFLCEEAGEVLEAHVVSALLPSVEHFIQIGDHQQLRPTINNWSTLSLESSRGQDYQLDRSQFERLALGQPGLPPIPLSQLQIQRRMRPDIADLLRRTTYPNLEDHESIRELPNVVGMRQNIFWLNHGYLEDTVGEDGRLKSHSNTWEVNVVQALVRHIVRQGVYRSEDIAVLTPYTGNLQKLRASLSSDFEITMSERDEETMARDGFSTYPTESSQSAAPSTLRKGRLVECIRLATVDNFQGEEAKVVIVSLVRSNHQKKVGFLRTVNRINVLMSRAQQGMYLVGNADTYSNVAMWNEIRGQLEAAGRIGPDIELCCPRHPDTAIRCSEPEDFARFSPEGGCNLACDRRLAPCGHKCQAKCHSERMHDALLCSQPCPRQHQPCGHSCDKLCGEDCGKCSVISQLMLSCGHFADDLPCHQAQQPSKLICRIEVEKEVPGCKHVIKAPCNTDVTVKGFHCPTQCNALLSDCGHNCSWSCGNCRKEANGEVKIVHRHCKVLCKRSRGPCGHLCEKRCHAGRACDPCRSRCEVRCAHSRCPLFCEDPCPPCIEKCAWSCEHQGGCSMPCAAPCDRLLCNERCTKKLKCGHQCPGLCGETCLEGYCQVCRQRVDSRVDLLEFRTYGEIGLDEKPIVALSCGHFFTAESLDGLVDIAEVYTLDDAGSYSGLRDPGKVLAHPSCPDCKHPIRQLSTRRYNRVINMAVMDETSKKFQMKGEAKLQKLEEHADAIEASLQDSCADLTMSRPESLTLGFRPAGALISYYSRYGSCRSLKTKIQEFCKAASIEQQPATKLSNAILHSRRVRESQAPSSSSSLDEGMAQLHLRDTEMPAPALNQQVMLGARMVQLRVDYIMLRDQLRLMSANPSEGITWPAGGGPIAMAGPFLQESESFIEDCQAARLPRLAVQASIAFARIVGFVGNSDLVYPGTMASEEYGTVVNKGGGKGKANGKSQRRSRTENVASARRRLEGAARMCEAGFEGATELLAVVKAMQRLFEGDRYEIVTADELASIKAAMVSVRGGIATHSGHWYKCRNGHIFAIGECGMPMELARCPECRAPIGGQQHQLVEGASRATEME